MTREEAEEDVCCETMAIKKRIIPWIIVAKNRIAN
jgi:hypothetical protein